MRSHPHHFLLPATVLQSLRTLQKKELVFRYLDVAGKPCFDVYDVLFSRWIGG